MIDDGGAGHRMQAFLKSACQIFEYLQTLEIVVWIWARVITERVLLPAGTA